MQDRKVITRIGDPKSGWIPSEDFQTKLASYCQSLGLEGKGFVTHYAFKIEQATEKTRIKTRILDSIYYPSLVYQNYISSVLSEGKALYIIKFGDSKAGWVPSAEHAQCFQNMATELFGSDIKFLIVPYTVEFTNTIKEKNIKDIAFIDYTGNSEDFDKYFPKLFARAKIKIKDNK